MKNLRIQGSSDILGLSDKEVQQRVDKGQVNILPLYSRDTIVSSTHSLFLISKVFLLLDILAFYIVLFVYF